MVVWGIASGEPEESVSRFVEQYGLSFPILMDTTGEVNRAYAQQMAFESAAYPQDWVVGVDGTVVYANNGFELDAMITAIEAELQGGGG